MTAIHTPATIYSRRHMPTWLLLSMAAGAVNCGAFLACERFVTHVTGTVARLGVETGHGLDAGDVWLMIDYGSALGGFILGAMASVLAIDGRIARGKQPLPIVPLVVVSAVLVVLALAGQSGAFGEFGTPVETYADVGMILLLSFAMGLQNAAVATSTGNTVRTTHLTGPATDFGVNVAQAFFTTGEPRSTALKAAGLRGGNVAAFILGAILMVPLTHAAGYLAFLGPAVVVLTSAFLSFFPATTAAPAPARDDTPAERATSLAVSLPQKVNSP